jgi:hypothetical protein
MEIRSSPCTPRNSLRQRISSTRALLILCALLSISCSAKTITRLNFNPAEPLRVAVLPFAAKDATGAYSALLEGDLLIDKVGIVSSELETSPLQIMRRAVIADLTRTGLEIVNTQLIDIELPHHGFAHADGSLNLDKLYRTSAVALCTQFTDCDAVLFGVVKDFSRSYYGIESVNSVSLELRLVSGRNESVLYEASGADSERRGLTQGPTGFSDLLIEPVKGLDSEIIQELARGVAKELTSPLVQKTQHNREQVPPPAIFASSFSTTVNKGAPSSLLVLMFGSSNQSAAFSIGSEALNIPMEERSPGHYVGEYIPLQGEKIPPGPVHLQLIDSLSRITSQTLAR